MSDVVIVGAKRTPLGSFQGALSTVPAPKLAATAISAALDMARVKPSDVEEVILGCVLPAGVGQSPARQALLAAGLPDSVAALTINKVCGSGLKAVMLASQAIRSGEAEVIIAGGMENMSLAPYALPRAREGYRMGHGEILDLMVHDGLWDPYHHCHMGNIGEKCAKEYGFSREEQDRFAAQSYRRAMSAIETGRFKGEIAAVSVPQRKGDPVTITTDEEPGHGRPDKLPSLRAVFDKNGSITAGNASSINDGAAALVVMSSDKARRLGVKPLVRIRAQAQASQAPDWFTTAPAHAMEKVLKKAGLNASDIDLWEVNEAFAVVSLFNNKALGIPEEKVNVNGGAIALGHPIGASGARILVTLIHELLKRPDAKTGLASLCIGGGEAVAMIIEKV